MGELSAIIGMLSAMDWNAVRNGLESLSAINWKLLPQDHPPIAETLHLFSGMGGVS
jgi:hypothetical protein